MLVNILKVNSVNTDGVCFDQDAMTALAFMTLKMNGESEFMFYRNPSANTTLYICQGISRLVYEELIGL
ncbi:hypothetical protein AQUCO_00400405v1 [Aquilegia coerulea]|uniref:Uncharacterized protein n=1 Tax=Aquilegia coerulea TaxID=218851 RepID=A0A2G5EUR6_AQUCA|nr:hypothetical protein AQUCO_00400405v1 [Aquilegia coerulea]